LEPFTFPFLGSYKIGEITTAEVLAVLAPIWLTKQETARRVRQRIGTVMKWAIAQGWRQDNPAENIDQALPKQTKAKQHRKALPYAEVARCIQAVQASGAGHSTKLALEFLILTAVRSGEARGAVWDEITLGDCTPANPANPANRAEWVIPADRMKMKRAHRVPLCARAVEILYEAKNLGDGGDLVFAGTKQGKPLSDMTLSKLVKELGFDVDVHGFRTSFRTWAQEKTDIAREVAETAKAESLRVWLLDKWPHPEILPSEVVQSGPNHMRELKAVQAAIKTLVDAGWLVPFGEGTEIRGKVRKAAYKIVKP
jgi:integrase